MHKVSEPPEANSDSWQNISINISENENWHDMIQQIELRFPCRNGNVEIDLIAVSADGLCDCIGDFQGDAFVDVCGNCVGGNSEIETCEDCMGVANGQAYLNGCGDCVGVTSTINENKVWPFKDLSNWTLNPRIMGYAHSGFAFLNISGDYPYMSFSENVCIDADSYKILKLKVRNNTNGNLAAIYYKNSITDVWNFIPDSLSTNDTELKEYNIDLSKQEN